MPLSLAEVVPGAVAILESAPILADPALVYPGDPVTFRTGPFMCIQVQGDRSAWLHLTRQIDKRGLRLKIEPEWKLHGSAIWQGNDQYISDARKPFIAPTTTFVLAGANELPHQPHRRPHVSQEGIYAAIAEMQKYNVTAL